MPATLHMLCGKMAAGKSTLAARLAQGPGTVLLSEDEWLAALFAGEITTGRDFVRASARLRQAMGPHVAALLDAGVSVVLDFQANTLEARGWMRGILDATSAAHVLHVLTPPDAVLLDRLRARNATGAHPFTVSEAQFHAFSKHFVLPTPEEGFTIRTYDTLP